MSIFYLDYENGSDANDGSDWANAWKTITNGPTAARIAPSDIIRIAKSPAPVSLGTTGAWTNLSRTVTLGAAQTLNIDMCEIAWTADGGGDATVVLDSGRKEGPQCMKITMDASPQASTLQAYYATGTLNLSSYQKISFWIKNEAVVADNATWVVKLCSDNAGQNAVDTFVIPAIPSTNRYLPLTIARTGGGNLGNAIESIAIYTGATAPAASKYVLVDCFIACTTAGLNLQSLISKNSAEQGGAEGWFGIKCINGTTIQLDSHTNSLFDVGQGYSGTTESVTIYKRETIKTALASSSSTKVQEVQDSGTNGNDIEFQGGYDTGTSLQTGETFFNGLNGLGCGLYLSSKHNVTLNYLNFYRYDVGLQFYYSYTCTIATLSNVTNNNYGIIFTRSHNVLISTLSNANDNWHMGIYYDESCNNVITTLSNVNSSENGRGLWFGSGSLENRVVALTNARNNAFAGVDFTDCCNNLIMSLSTSDNGGSGISNTRGRQYLRNALIAEATEVADSATGANDRIYSWQHDQTADNHWTFSDGGTISTTQEAGKRHTASGVAWKFAPESSRNSGYVLDELIAEIAVVAGTEVTVKCWVKKDHATDIAAKLVCRGGQLAGVVSDVSDTKADDIVYEQLSISFTPTETGVIEIEGWAWYVSGNSYVYFDDIEVTQG